MEIMALKAGEDKIPVFLFGFGLVNGFSFQVVSFSPHTNIRNLLLKQFPDIIPNELRQTLSFA
jgi:hypothetical protein